MKNGFVVALLGAVLLFTVAAQADAVGYNLTVTTAYGFSTPFAGPLAPGSAGYGPSPDTGFFQLTNTGSTTFVGTLGDIAVSPGGDFSQTSTTFTLAPGQSVWESDSPEGSNLGGFNGPTGTPQPGINILINGTMDGTEAISLSVSDSNIHSGVIRTSPCDGISTDAYVLQGGSPTGCDNGDAFETTQAEGNFVFSETVATTPEPGSLVLLGSGLIGLGSRLRKRIQK